MPLKIRIMGRNGTTLSATSPTTELLTALSDAQNSVILLDNDEEESLRGWLLVRAQSLEDGETQTIEEDKTVCIGKSADGRPYVRDTRGNWPPLKPDFGTSQS